MSLQELDVELKLRSRSEGRETETTPAVQLGPEGPPGQLLADARRCSPLSCHISSFDVEDVAFPLQYFKPHHYKPGQQGRFSEQELGREAFCLPAVSGGKQSSGNGPSDTLVV